MFLPVKIVYLCNVDTRKGMKRLNRKSLQAELSKDKKKIISLSVDVFSYLEKDNLTYTYCPALDLIAYGDSEEQSLESFIDILKDHLVWCIEHNTLESDLTAHGWVKKGRRLKHPLVTSMLMNNDILRDIVDNKSYRKTEVLLDRKQMAFA